MKTVKVETREQLKELYDDWSLTFEGVKCDDEKDLKPLVEWLNKNGGGKGSDKYTFYITTGRIMNKICLLGGDNAYPDDLTIISIKSKDYDASKIAIPSKLIGGRWMTDIIDNNARRENYFPFNIEEI